MADIERTGVAQAEFDRWSADAEMVAQEAERQITAHKAFLDAEAALTEFDEYLHTLSLEDHQTALEGLKEYGKAVVREREIEAGWHAKVE